MPSPYWESQTAPLYGAARTIGSGIASLPMMRAMAANRAAQGQFYQAHAEQEQAAAGEAAARQAQIQQAIETEFGKTSSGTQFSKTLARILPIMSDPNSTPEARRQAASDAMSDFGQLAADKPDEALKTFETMEQLGRNNPGDFTQNFIAMNGGKMPTGSDALSDEQLAAAQSAKGAPAANAASTATIAANLPANVIKSVEQSQPIPNNPAMLGMTPKPLPLTMSQALQGKLQNTFVQLVQNGVPPAQAEIYAKGLVMGTNATAQPTITTKNPGSPEVRTPGRLWGTNVTPAVPPTLSTNSFHVASGGADQTMVGQLAKDPRFSGVLNQLGLAPTAGATQTSTAESQLPDFTGQPTTTNGQPKQLDPDTARQFLQQAGGDKNKARQMATQAGYTF